MNSYRAGVRTNPEMSGTKRGWSKTVNDPTRKIRTRAVCPKGQSLLQKTLAVSD